MKQNNFTITHLTTWVGQSLTIAMLLFIFLLQVACSKNADEKSVKNLNKLNTTTNTQKTVTQRRADAQAAVERGYIDQSKITSNGKDFGVKILAVRRTAKGYMLDFRFKIFDLEKAKDIMQRKVKALLTIEKNGQKLIVPVTYKLGALRQSGNNLVENKQYFMFFANPGGKVKAGDLVTFQLGGFKAEHITVN